MEKIFTQSKISKINLDTMFFEIILSTKGNSFRVRSASLAQIPNINIDRPEATSTISYENAIQKLIPKIENSLEGTDKCLGKIFQSDSGKLMYSIENIIYKNNKNNSSQEDSLNMFTSIFVEVLKNLAPSLNINNNNVQQVSDVIVNNVNDITKNSQLLTNTSNHKKFSDICVEWLQHLLERTKKNYDDEDYLTPGTLEGYNRVLRDHVFPYLEEHSEYDNILFFVESNVDEILDRTNSKDTKRLLLISLRLIFEFAKENCYIKVNPIANKKQKRKKKTKKDYDFIEEDQRAIWINCMLKEIRSIDFENTDAALSFLCMLLHGNRPEEVCGTKWIDFNFKENDYHIQNAYKKFPIYDEGTMKRIGWQNGDGTLKTPESDRHLSLDVLFKQLLLEHRVRQMYQYRQSGKKWSENEYVFHNSSGTPFTPDILSKNFVKFIKRNQLPKIVLYGLRHSFATHCRNLGVKPEVLARLMGHTEYETTQKYYIHISAKQKREALQKVQKHDIQGYLGEKNKNLVHLQSNVNYYSKEVANLEQVQQEDMTYYLQLDDETLSVLKNVIEKISQKEKSTA